EEVAPELQVEQPPDAIGGNFKARAMTMDQRFHLAHIQVRSQEAVRGSQSGIEHARQRGRGITGVPIAQIRLSSATLPEEGVVVTKPAMPHMIISLSNKCVGHSVAT